MLILVLNVGSTSLKWQLIMFPGEKVLFKGKIENIGTATCHVSWQYVESPSEQRDCPNMDYAKAVEFVKSLLDPTKGLSDIACIAFKTVISDGYNGCEMLDKEVLAAMERFIFLAPAHNPPYITAIKFCQEIFPGIPLVGLFEPAFHTTIPECASVYALPKSWREKGVRPYGFHGASHRWASERAAELMELDEEESDFISLHLGGSSSGCAIRAGKSIDTTMGFTPQTGFFHAYRIGDFDVFGALYMMQVHGLSVDDVIRDLTENSGFLGLSEISEDLRVVIEAMQENNAQAKLAFDAFVRGIVKTVGAYYALLPNLKALIFTGGIGERSLILREAVCSQIEHLGITFDRSKNDAVEEGKEKFINGLYSPVKVICIPADEELIVAREAYKKLQELENAA